MNTKQRNKIISKTYYQHKEIFTICAKSVIRLFNNVPLNLDDLINYSLFYLPQIVEDYDKKFNHCYEKYLFYKVKYLMINYCKKFTTKSHQVLNLALNYTFEEIEIEDPNSTIFLNNFNYQEEPKEWLQTKFQIQDDLELSVLVYYFFEGFKTKQISLKTNMSSFKINNILKKFEKKIQAYVL